jgi:glycosyltransferase involved in cell wall biosynthesis
MTDLSVVVPAFNARAHLTATLASLRQNAGPGIELLVVDDASTDGTAGVVEALQDQVPGLRLLRSPRNVGLASARNLGLTQARGRYLMFLDADDWLAPGYLRRLLDVAARFDVDFLRTDHVQVRGLQRRVHRAPVAHRDVVLQARDHILPSAETTMVDYPYAWAGLVDRTRVPEALLRFDDGLRTAEDRPWIWRLHRHGRSFVVPSGTPGHFYRREVSSSLTSLLDERQLDFTIAFGTVIDELQADGEPEALLDKAVRTTCVVVAHHLARSDAMHARVRAALVRRSSALLQRLPEPALHRVLAALDSTRRLQLVPLLGSGAAGRERASALRARRSEEMLSGAR